MNFSPYLFPSEYIYFSYSIVHCSCDTKKWVFSWDISLVTPQLLGEGNQLTDTIEKRF